jgi:ADP-ribose pyrophosphatase
MYRRNPSYYFVLISHPRITYNDPEGQTRTWESGERLTRPKGSDIDGVGVVAILRDPANPNESPRIVLQKQFRPPLDQVVIEIPAGLMDPKESPETCAIRELKEESGYVGEIMGAEEGFGVSPVMFNGGDMYSHTYSQADLCYRPRVLQH